MSSGCGCKAAYTTYPYSSCIYLIFLWFIFVNVFVLVRKKNAKS